MDSPLIRVVRKMDGFTDKLFSKLEQKIGEKDVTDRGSAEENHDNPAVTEDNPAVTETAEPATVVGISKNDVMVEADAKSVKLSVKVSEIYESLRTVHGLTSTDNLPDAMELVWFKFDMRKDKKIKDIVSLLATLWRCTKDGCVTPPVDLEEAYKEVVSFVSKGIERVK